MIDKTKINDERIGDRFYFYHTSYSLDAYTYFNNGTWRTRKGYYGKGVYGFNSPPNKSMAYGNIVFRFQCLRPHRVFFANVDLGKTFLAGYSVNMGLDILEDHDVPDDKINDKGGLLGLRSVLEGKSINSSVLYTGTPDIINWMAQYDFDGMAYQSHDGYAMLFWNFGPHLLRITGVKNINEATFRDIPVGATQKQVEDIYYGRVSKTATTNSGGKGSVANVPISGYASASLLKHVSRFPQAMSKFEGIITSWLQGSKPTVEEAIFIESWYLRYNLRSRMSVYGSGSDVTQRFDLVSASAAIVAYSSSDSRSPVKIGDTRSVCDFNRLNKYICDFSLSHNYSQSVWSEALGLLGFFTGDVVAIVPSLYKVPYQEVLAVQCLHGMIESSIKDVGLKAGFLARYCAACGIDLIEEYNNRVGKSAALFISDTTSISKITKEIDRISYYDGIVFK